MENQEEVWVEMWDYPKYEISNIGNVRNAKTERLLTVIENGQSYRMVSLWADKKSHTKRVGRFVWQSHNRQFCSETVDHINQNSLDDRLENLRCVDMRTNRGNRKNVPYGTNVYNLTKKDKGYIHYTIKNGFETSWTIMKSYGIPMNYLGTTIKRNSWQKYVELLTEEDYLNMKIKKVLNDFERL
jgi:hypothetical protein